MKDLTREEFDPGRGFVATRHFKYAGVTVSRGDVIDPSKATARRLRQMYEGRMISMLPPEMVAELEAVSVAKLNGDPKPKTTRRELKVWHGEPS